jgi:hypothetical protein
MLEKAICKPDWLPYCTKIREEHGTTPKPISDLTPTAKIEPFNPFWGAPKLLKSGRAPHGSRARRRGHQPVRRKAHCPDPNVGSPGIMGLSGGRWPFDSPLPLIYPPPSTPLAFPCHPPHMHLRKIVEAMACMKNVGIIALSAQ